MGNVGKKIKGMVIILWVGPRRAELFPHMSATDVFHCMN
jgi:hypothetical protein